jgi:Bacterial protein YqhG of unknown function
MMPTAPLRTPAERLAFCDLYFQSVGAETTYSAPEYREYLLPLDVDKELTDRPFYWMWAEKTGQTIVPTILRLAFNEETQIRETARLREEALSKVNINEMTPMERMFFRPPVPELVNLGSFRINKLHESLTVRGQFASVVPLNASENAKFVPWLVLNGLITYRCDSLEQSWFSVGICMLNGQCVHDFFENVQRIPMRSVPPQQLMSQAKLQLDVAVANLQKAVENIAENHPKEWADEATERLRKELQQVDTYYQSILPDIPPTEYLIVKTEHERKRIEMIERCTPRIDIEWTQCALVGLTER